jgi:hypothetical protein
MGQGEMGAQLTGVHGFVIVAATVFVRVPSILQTRSPRRMVGCPQAVSFKAWWYGSVREEATALV